MITYRIDAQNISAIISTLSKGMYAYPTSSVIREMIANAIDTQRLVNKEDIPIDISLPYSLDKFVRIRDEGEGMSREFVESTWVSFGSSTKRDIDNQMGKFGLGSKSFVAISNVMELVTVKDGIKYFYFIYTSNSNNINLVYVGEEPTKDCNGTCIGIPTEFKNRGSIKNAVLYWTQFFKVKPIIKGTGLKEEDTSFSVTPIPLDFDINGVKFQGDNWQYYSHFNGTRQLAPPLLNKSVVLLIGEFPYQLSAFNEGDNLRYLCDFKLLISAYGKAILPNNSERLGCPLVVKVDSNKVALQEPRELINIEDEGTKEYLIKLLADIRCEIEGKLKEVDRSYSCPIDKFLFRLKLSIVNLSPVNPAYLEIGDSGNLYIRIRTNKLVNQRTEYLNKEIVISNIDKLYRSGNRFWFLDRITWVYDDTPGMKDKKQRLIIGKYMNEHDIDILVIYSNPDITNTSHITLSHIEDSYKVHQLPPINTNKPTINKGRTSGINVYEYIGQETSCEVGLYGYSRIVNVPKDVTDNTYYIEINRGSLYGLDGFVYAASTNPQVFLPNITKVLDGPLYLVKSADIKRLGRGWIPVSDLLLRDDWLKMKKKKELLLVMNSTLFKYQKQHLVLDWFIQDSEIRDKLKEGLGNDNPLFNRLFELGDILNKTKAYINEEQMKMSLINIDLRARDKTFLLTIEDIVERRYPLLKFLDYGKVTHAFITALNQYISLIGMEPVPSILQEDNEALLYKLFDV